MKHTSVQTDALMIKHENVNRSFDQNEINRFSRQDQAGFQKNSANRANFFSPCSCLISSSSSVKGTRMVGGHAGRTHGLNSWELRGICVGVERNLTSSCSRSEESVPNPESTWLCVCVCVNFFRLPKSTAATKKKEKTSGARNCFSSSL